MSDVVSDQRCELTELLVDQCAHCQGHKAPIALGGSIAMRAHYGGRCAADDRHRIEVGDFIYSSPAGWLCRECSGH